VWSELQLAMPAIVPAFIRLESCSQLKLAPRKPWLRLRIGFLALTVGLAAPTAAQEPTIRVPVRLVNMTTLVVSKDMRLVSDLQPHDFRVLDNGRLQAVRVEPNVAPVSVAVVVQANPDVRSYLPFIAGAGSVIETLLAGEGGEVALFVYGSDVRVTASLKQITPAGEKARLLDAAALAISFLAKQPRSRSRLVLFIGQPVDSGSETDLDSVRRSAEREDVAVYSLALPMAGRAFVSDTFSLNGPRAGEGTAVRGGVDVKKLIEVLSRRAAVAAGADPFTVLAAATGGAQFHFRSQKQLEGVIAALGAQLRSGYVLSYYPSSTDPGYHAVTVESTIPGAKVFTRPGYWLTEDRR
jgi:VWFA-related protein